jgi:hypothetical protein
LCSDLAFGWCCAAGKLKGKEIQYHALCDKKSGESLYAAFVAECQAQVATLNGSATAAAPPNSAAAGAAATPAAAPASAPTASASGGAAAAAAAATAPPRFRVAHGTYGNRQALNVTSDGPLTHVLDF